MIKETLYNKIFRMFTILVLVSTLVLLFVVWNSTYKTIAANVDKQLSLAQTVVSKELATRQNSIKQDAKVLLDDSAFKQAIAAGNRNSVQASLISMGQVIDAAFLNIHLHDRSLYSTSESHRLMLTESQIYHGIHEAKKEGQFSTFLMLDDSLTWVFWLPIHANHTNDSNIHLSQSFPAYAIMGFVVNQAYLKSIKDLIAVDLSMHASPDHEQIVSSLPQSQHSLALLEESLLENYNSIWNLIKLFGTDHTLLSRKFSLSQTGEVSSEIYLSVNADEHAANFLTLQLTIGAISLFALCVAMLTGRMLARKITRPIEHIADYAENISKGKYSKGLELTTCSLEIEQLLNAFRAMEQNVKRRESEIVYQAKHDMLTSLYNRNYFTEHLDKLFEDKTEFQAIAINIKNFRSINDVFGYQYGDMLLQELSARIHKLDGTSARISGGEILWIPSESLHLHSVERIKDMLEAPIEMSRFTMSFRTTIGILNCPSDTKNSEDLYRRLNIAIDEAQFTPTLMAEFTNTFENKYLRRLAIINKLKTAIIENKPDLSLHYQPKLALATKSVTQVEALIRWNDKELGFIPPDEFIEVAEHAGLINDVTTWVIKRCADDLLLFKSKGLNLKVAINISAQDLLSDNFVSFVTELLKEKELSTQDITFELTENVIVAEPKKAIQHIQALKEAGFSVAIDDFGKGYSSLSYVTQLPVDTIKIDKCFVMPLAQQRGEQAICQAVLSLAKSFNMCVVAEGVEDEESMQMLTKWGCEYAQGYHISRPISSHDLVTWMAMKLQGEQVLNAEQA